MPSPSSRRCFLRFLCPLESFALVHFVIPWQTEVGFICLTSSLFFVVMYLVPMSLMMTLNVLLLIALRRSQTSRLTTLGYRGVLPTAVPTRRRLLTVNDDAAAISTNNASPARSANYCVVIITITNAHAAL